VLVTRHGRPAALIIGVEGVIEARRKTSKTISADEMARRLRVAKKPRSKRTH
jgi:antitoxin (DNA-binding transcriptional repressor) of toxin-antitoxin stability system